MDFFIYKWFDYKIRIKKSIFNSESKIMYIVVYVVCQSFGGWKVWRKRIDCGAKKNRSGN